MIDYLKIHFVVDICNLLFEIVSVLSKFSLHKSIEEQKISDTGYITGDIFYRGFTFLDVIDARRDGKEWKSIVTAP